MYLIGITYHKLSYFYSCSLSASRQATHVGATGNYFDWGGAACYKDLMLALLSNDDGINAPGLKAIYTALADMGDVVLVAPDKEQSAAGHAITIADPLRVRKVYENGSFFGYSVDGTPADCVKIAVEAIMPRHPDIVVSGINHGCNVATNIIYSGTVSAATEGTLLGIPSIALSMNSYLNPDFSRAVKWAIRIIQKTVKTGLPLGTLLNVNFPAPEIEIRGIKICRVSDCSFKVSFEKRHDPRGIDYYWQGGAMDKNEPDKDTDIRAVEDGYVAITPIRYDLTDRNFLADLKSWEF